MDNLTLTDNPTPVHPQEHQSKVKYLLGVGISLILLFSLGLGYLFWWVPRVQAKEYLETVGQDFSLVYQKISVYTDGFNPLSESFLTSREAFFEVTTSRTYDEAVIDTKQDIEDIRTTLKLVEQARQTQQGLIVPPDFQTLDQVLDKYYQDLEQGLELLLEFEVLQMQMLEASGQALNDEIKKVDNEVKTGAARQDLIEYFGGLERLGNHSIEAFNQIKDVPQAHQDYYNLMLEHHTDLVKSSQEMIADLKLNSEAGDSAMVEKFLAMIDRVQLRNHKQKEMARQFLAQSPIKGHFESALVAENQIKNQLETLSHQYGIRANIPVKAKTPSTNPPAPLPAESTSSAESSPSVILD